MDTSFFVDKNQIPDNEGLKSGLGEKYHWWMSLRDYVFEKYPGAIEMWYYAGVKFGWAFRIKDKKRAIIYFLPFNQQFRVSMVFGEKATQKALAGNISNEIKKIIEEAPVYAEGRGFRIPVSHEHMLADIKVLIDIKIDK